MSSPPFTVCALFYGDYPDLARRCLDSFSREIPTSQASFRLGLNAVSEETRRVVEGFANVYPSIVYDTLTNIHKYPKMREMLHDQAAPVKTPYVMWFDDDSYVSGMDRRGTWITLAWEAMQHADMIGALYSIGYRGGQREWIRQQPWYAGKEPGGKASFITGGWWCIKSPILHRHNWPVPELDHRGGDVMLGELCRQHGYRLKSFTRGVCINADALGNQCAAKRRGFDSAPIGSDYVAVVPEVKSDRPKIMRLE